MKEYEKELRDEKSKEEEFERKLREMRKERNKARLKNERNTNPPPKRQKTDEDRFISIRTTWTTAPKKEKREPERQETRKRQKLEKETHTNIRRVEDKVWEGETLTDFDIIVTTEEEWEVHLREHQTKLEEEMKEKERLSRKKEIKKKSCLLYRESKMFLEENEESWKKRKLERDQEKERLERTAIAKEKQEKLRNKIKERKLKEDITARMKELPQKERMRI